MPEHRDHPVTDFAAAVGGDGQLVDVREPHEVANGTLPGARNIPLGELPIRIDELDPDRPVVLLCRSGVRSTQAAELLTDEGFGDVVNLAGGMLAYDEQR
ncbi:MAG: rhodanese-like domain-containing protein [Acidimicrobiia bacterium]|nr:rhodanese-like domain-containing protein [Acidimicrobiia bacterium]